MFLTFRRIGHCRGGARIFELGRQRASLITVGLRCEVCEAHLPSICMLETRGVWGHENFLKIDAKILQFRDIFTQFKAKILLVDIL